MERLIEDVAEHVDERPAANGVRELLAELPRAA